MGFRAFAPPETREPTAAARWRGGRPQGAGRSRPPRAGPGRQGQGIAEVEGGRCQAVAAELGRADGQAGQAEDDHPGRALTRGGQRPGGRHLGGLGPGPDVLEQQQQPGRGRPGGHGRLPPAGGGLGRDQGHRPGDHGQVGQPVGGRVPDKPEHTGPALQHRHRPVDRVGDPGDQGERARGRRPPRPKRRRPPGHQRHPERGQGDQVGIHPRPGQGRPHGIGQPQVPGGQPTPRVAPPPRAGAPPATRPGTPRRSTERRPRLPRSSGGSRARRPARPPARTPGPTGPGRDGCDAGVRARRSRRGWPHRDPQPDPDPARPVHRRPARPSPSPSWRVPRPNRPALRPTHGRPDPRRTAPIPRRVPRWGSVADRAAKVSGCPQPPGSGGSRTS